MWLGLHKEMALLNCLSCKKLSCQEYAFISLQGIVKENKITDLSVKYLSE